MFYFRVSYVSCRKSNLNIKSREGGDMFSESWFAGAQGKLGPTVAIFHGAIDFKCRVTSLSYDESDKGEKFTLEVHTFGRNMEVL